jgi:hypothetical protein
MGHGEAAPSQGDGEGARAAAHLEDRAHARQVPLDLAPAQGAVDGLIGPILLFRWCLSVPPLPLALEINFH